LTRRTVRFGVIDQDQIVHRKAETACPIDKAFEVDPIRETTAEAL